MYKRQGLQWQKFRVILATIHRRENWDQLSDIGQSFLTILDKFPDVALLLPLHRNPTVREPLRAILGHHQRAFLIEPLDYGQLVGAMQNCYLVMTDSGGLQEEAPSLGKPVLVLRETTERPEAINEGTAKLVGTSLDKIVSESVILLENKKAYNCK